VATYEVYREVFKITERRDGAVYRTESQGFQWVDGDIARRYQDGDLIYAAPPLEYDGVTIRRKK
jgi:hypothetical protein